MTKNILLVLIALLMKVEFLAGASPSLEVAQNALEYYKRRNPKGLHAKQKSLSQIPDPAERKKIRNAYLSFCFRQKKNEEREKLHEEFNRLKENIDQLLQIITPSEKLLQHYTAIVENYEGFKKEFYGKYEIKKIKSGKKEEKKRISNRACSQRTRKFNKEYTDVTAAALRELKEIQKSLLQDIQEIKVQEEVVDAASFGINERGQQDGQQSEIPVGKLLEKTCFIGVPPEETKEEEGVFLRMFDDERFQDGAEVFF